MSDVRVLVSGASIAGPALAHWLHRRGAEVTVVEQAPGLRPGGQAVDARGVAKEAIRRMGLDAAVRAVCTDTAGAYTVDADGNVLQTYRADDDDGDGYISEIEVLRGDFSEVLYDDTRDRVDYVFGDRIAGLTQDVDGVDVTFASGQRRRFELVIGADGLHSALRAMVFGPREQFVRHLGLVLAFYTVPNEFGLDRWLLDYQQAGRSAGLRPVRDAGRAIAMLSFPARDFDIDYRDVEAQKRLLREQMAGFGWLTPRILAHLDDTPDFYLDQVAQVVMDRWSSGRVGLLGDAAFCASPMSGAGTGLALVGAYLLAGELAAADWDPAAGFAGYEEQMRGYVEANQEIGRLHVQMLTAPAPDAQSSPEPDPEAFTDLIDRAVNGPELPDYEGLPDSRTAVGPVIVRERVAGDIAACVPILAAVHERDGYPTRWPLDPSDWLSPDTLIGAWVAEQDHAIIGHIGIYSPVDVPALSEACGRDGAELAAITRLFIDPATRRTGAGQALLETATARACELGVTPVLDVVESGTAAIALYERLGWRYVTSEPATWANAVGEHPTVRYYVGP